MSYLKEEELKEILKEEVKKTILEKAQPYSALSQAERLERLIAEGGVAIPGTEVGGDEKSADFTYRSIDERVEFEVTVRVKTIDHGVK